MDQMAALSHLRALIKAAKGKNDVEALHRALSEETEERLRRSKSGGSEIYLTSQTRRQNVSERNCDDG